MDDASEPAAVAPSAFGLLVKQLRLAKGWSQGTLARESGLSNGYISLVETGQRGTSPTPRTLVAMAKALECDPVPLFEAAGRRMPLADIQKLQARVEGPSEVILAIQRDPLLRPGEREELVRQYIAFTSGRGPAV